MLGLLGKKLGQTRVYNEQGQMVPVTVVRAGPNYVIQCKTAEKDDYNAVQLGFDGEKQRRANKPRTGHFQKHNAPPVKFVRELRDFPLSVQPGQELGVTVFEAGDFVDVIGRTKGRGFQGVVKRYNFGGGVATHGTKGWMRRPGSIAGGRLTPGHVRKGTKMPGQMGQRRRTVQNLEIVQVLEEENVILVKGSIPGANGDYVVVREAKKKPKAKEEAK